MLEARALGFGFPGRSVGRDVSFAVGAGEVLCVLGPNGSGKTTLFRTLLGLLERQGGEVSVGGARLDDLGRADIARRAGYVPQGHSAYFAFTVLEFVLMGRTAHLGTFSTPGRHDVGIAAQALESLGIAHLAGKPVTEVSGGERQLALIARALAQEPRLLVMDEPTAGLDFGNQVRVMERIAALARSGIAVLFSSHNPDHALLVAQHVLLLREGGMLALGEPRAVIRPEALEQLYGVRIGVIELPGGRLACVPSLGA